MELRYSGIFDTGASSGIYQRLAVGKTAVQQDGASMMFAKNADGDVDVAVARALRTLKGHEADEVEALPCQERITAAYAKADTSRKQKFDSAAAALGFRDFKEFGYAPASQERNEKMLKALRDNQISGVACEAGGEE